MKKNSTALMALAFTLALVLPALAEDTTPAATGQQAQNAEAKALRTEIVKLKYVNASNIQNLLYAYISRDGHIQVNRNMPNVLTVTDTPENVEKILAAVRELDVKPADVLYTVQLVLGSEIDATTDPELKNDPVIKELGRLLRYKGYTLLDSTLVRVMNRDRASVVMGPKAEFELALTPDVAADAKAPTIKTEVRLRQIERLGMTQDKEGKPQPIANVTTPIESTLNIKSGERTVVGVSKLDGGDKGLILIISAKVVD
jgi:type II secretory pathway component GspD/PulD (secretin)